MMTKIKANGKMYFDGIGGVILLKSDEDVIDEVKYRGINEALYNPRLKLKEKGAYSFVMCGGCADDDEKFYSSVIDIKKIAFIIDDIL